MKYSLPFLFFFYLSLSLDYIFQRTDATISQRYNSLFSFCDSLSDAGNFLVSNPSTVIGRFPYGETFFKRATGRNCDGRLVIDFIAKAFGLPLLPPYLGLSQGQDISRGVNFAVAGATALDPEFFYNIKLGPLLLTNNSLSVQLGWFKKIKSSLCSSKQDCENYFKKTLLSLGEIGGNDLNYALLAGLPIDQVRTFVPLIVQAISNATSREGAVKLVVPGNYPIGCLTVFLSTLQSPNKTDYDPTNGCLKAYNAFSEYYNNQLKLSLDALRFKYPSAEIIYGDFYGAAMRFYLAPELYGFSNGSLTACCGGGGPYNFNISVRCGFSGYKLCEDPSLYANWDGLHLTEAAYRIVANGLLYGPFSTPPLIAS